MASKKTTAVSPPTNAEYQGAVSRWCSLHNSVPDPGPKDCRPAMELDALSKYLDEQQNLRRNQPTTSPTNTWEF